VRQASWRGWGSANFPKRSPLYDKVNVLTQGIGTGPYKLVEFVPNDRVVYQRFADQGR
jgi:ABC-type transport system substrate-binding protein